MMNPSPTEIVELFVFVEVTLIQYATVAGHFPGVNASSVKPEPKKATKVEITSDEPAKGETQINATAPTTPRPKPKAQPKPRLLLKLLRQKWRINRRKPKRKGKVVAKESVGGPNPE